MTTATTGKLVSSASELLPLAELTAIHTYEVRGLRIDPDPDRSSTPAQDVQVMVQGDDAGIETRVKLVVTTPEADLVADVGARYTYSEPLDISSDAITEFIEKVGVMAVFPFLRESVFTSATRLGVAPPVLGLLRAGAFHISPSAPQGEEK